MNTLNRTVLYVLLAVAALVALPSLTFAQAIPAGSFSPVLYPQSLPGQAWIDTGNIIPTEHNDFVFAGYAEQGITLWRGEDRVGQNSFEALGSVGITADNLGYTWNNRITSSVGGRFNKYVGTKGIVELSLSYSYEDRWLSHLTKGGITPQVDYWFGWQPVASKTSRFPGSTWGAAGWLSPVEYHNFIYTQYAKQGVVAKRYGTHTVIQPYVEVTTSTDKSRFDWENYVRPGAGVELIYSKGNSMTELGGGYVYEDRPISHQTAGGYSVFLKVWLGWNPIRERGGR